MQFLKKAIVTYLLIGLMCGSEKLIASVQSTTNSITAPSPDENQSQSIINPDESKLIRYFNPDHSGREVLRKPNETIFNIFNNQSKTTSSIKIHSNGVKSLLKIDPAQPRIENIYTYFPDGTKRWSQTNLNTNTNITRETSIDGTSVTASNSLNDHLLDVAYHEAAHAVAGVFNYGLFIVDKTTIQPTSYNFGSITPEPTYSTNKNIKELQNFIISGLSGGCGNQLYNSEKMLTNKNDILQFYAQKKYKDDIRLIRASAKEIVIKQSPQLNIRQIEEEIDNIIVGLYKKSYEFIFAHTNDVKKVAHALITHETLSTNDLYTLLNTSKPLTDKEEGPLEKKFANDYKHREKQIKTEYNYKGKKSSKTIVKPDKTFIKILYDDKNGAKSYKAIKKPDKTEVRRFYNPDGTITITHYDAQDNEISSQTKPMSQTKSKTSAKEPQLTIESVQPQQEIFHLNPLSNSPLAIKHQKAIARLTAQQNTNLTQPHINPAESEYVYNLDGQHVGAEHGTHNQHRQIREIA